MSLENDLRIDSSGGLFILHPSQEKPPNDSNGLRMLCVGGNDQLGVLRIGARCEERIPTTLTENEDK